MDKPHFIQNYAVRYDDCNLREEVTPAAVLRFLQDIAGLHASQLDILGGGTWIARRTIINFHAPVLARSNLQVLTYPQGHTRILGQRSYEVRLLDEAGLIQTEPVLTARTLWVWLNPNGRPKPIPADILTKLHPNGFEPAQGEIEWPAFPAREPLRTAAKVRFSDIDIVGHMNNAAYVQLLDDAAWEVSQQRPETLENLPRPLSYDIEYLASAMFGEEVEILTWFEIVSGNPAQTVRWQQIFRGSKLLLKARSVWS